MANMQVSGLTGFDSASMVQQLMSVERLSGKRFTDGQKASNTLISALQGLNTQFKSLGDAAKAFIPDTLLGGVSAWRSTTATSSNKDVATAVTGSNAQPTSLTFSVTKLAEAGKVQSDATFTVDQTFSASTIDITYAASATDPAATKTASISIADGDKLADVVDKINKAGIGVQANMVQTSPGVYGLQVTSKATGAGTDIQISNGALGSFTQLSAGANAELQLGGGGYTVTSPSNTFKDVLPGVTVTANQVSAPGTSVTIDVKSDTTAISDKVKALVDAANTALKTMADGTKYDPDKKTAGNLNGESTVRDVQYKLQSVFTGADAGSLASMGVEFQKDGTIKFDKAKFEAAYTKDPSAVEKTFTDTATKIADLSKQTTNSADGYLTVRIQGEQAILKDYTARLADFNDRMTLREQALSKQFSALETLLSKMQSQGQWLSGQLASLSASSSK